MPSYIILWNAVHITQHPNCDNLWRIGSSNYRHIDRITSVLSMFNIQEVQDENLLYVQFEAEGRHEIFVRATQSQIEEMVQCFNEVENNASPRTSRMYRLFHPFVHP